MKHSNTAILLIALVLTACSTGDGGTAPPAPPVPTLGLALTSANAIEAGKLSWEAANQSASMADFTETSGLIASSPGGVNKLQSTIMAIGSGDSTVQGLPFGPVDIDCQIGFIRIEGEISDPFTPTLTREDFFNSDYRDCDEGLGESIRGLAQMTVDSFTGELALGEFDLTATLIITDLQVMLANDTLMTNGAITVTVDTMMFPVVTASVTGAALTTDSNGRSETLFDFQTTHTIDPGLELSPYTLDSSGTLESTALTGAFSYSTPVPFQGFGVAFPSSGELFIEGENSSVLLTAMPDGVVVIEIDSDGVPGIDETITTTWDALTS